MTGVDLSEKETDPASLLLEGMQGENIICFSKDWNESPTSNNHVMRELAKKNQVLWLNSISMRAPSLDKHDLTKIGRKLAQFFQGPKQVDENLWVYTPIVLPFPHSRFATALNSLILRWTIGALRRKLGMRQFQLWTFLPNAVDYVGKLGESFVAYYCIDEWSKFGYLDGRKMAEAEDRLCKQADVVFATAQSLLDGRKGFNPESHLASHGVDYKFFATALEESTPLAAELEPLPRPIVGFYGLIHEWIDLDLIAYLAERHPEWSLVMVGNPRVDVSSLKDRPNVHFLGNKPYAELPRYCKGFSAGLIPFKVNDLTVHVNPIKLREYLSAGIPVVSTDLPEVRLYEDCAIANSFEEFERRIEEALANDTPARRRARSESMQAETWERKVADLGATVMRIKRSRCQIP
jgi:glycosyltransferase involved in cell wall biosynthesis